MSFLSVLARRARSATALAAFVLATVAGAAPAADTPVQGGTLIYLEQQAHTNLYPPSGGFYPNSGVLNQITDKLTWQNPETLENEPWIAESWEINADATEYTFKLRPGVTFSDGTPVDAAAVALNFDTFGLGNKDLGYPISEVINNYERSEVIDPLTVKFYFSAPAPGFLQGTSVIGSGLVAAATLALPFNELGDATKIIASGAFVVESEVLGQSLTLKAREDYAWGPASFEHQGRAYLDGIQFIVTPEDSVRIGALLAGQADFIRQIQAYDEAQVEAQGYVIYAAPTRGVNNNVSFRPDNPLVADVRVRKALTTRPIPARSPDAVLRALSAGDLGDRLDRPRLRRSRRGARLRSGQGDDAARRGGWTVGADGIREKDGVKLELSVYESLPQPQNKATLQLLSQQWAQIGVKLNVLAGDSGSAATDNLDPLKTPLRPAMVGRADPDVVKSNFYPRNRDALLQKGGLSDKVQSFVDDELNALLEAVAAEPDREKRLALTGDAQRHLLEQAYVIPIFEEPQVFAGAPYLHGISFDAVARPSFYNAWLEPR